MQSRLNNTPLPHLVSNLEQLAVLVSQAQTNKPELKELRTATRGKERASRAAIVWQRAAKWEQRANEYEAELEGARLVCEQVEDRVAQLEAEHSLVLMQLDEKDAKEHLTKDRESKLHDQVTALWLAMATYGVSQPAFVCVIEANYQRQAIDAQIKSLEGSIRTFKLCRNALAPISSLPTKVIATIFSSLHLESGGLAWLRVAHVCHRWPEIALNQPLFWSHVDFTVISSAGAAEILARIWRQGFPAASGMMLGLAHFKKNSRCTPPTYATFALAQSPANSAGYSKGSYAPAPILESLSLFGRASQDGTLEAPVGTFVPDTLFDGSTPRLSGLELSDCDLGWSSPLFVGSLKHLEISTPSERPSLSVWLDALDEMPQLETLVLRWASPIAPPGASLSPDVDRTVTLPSLILFEISSFARDCGCALAHLILPALTSLCIISESCHRGWSDVRDILPHVSRHAHGSQDSQPLRSMVIENGITHSHILAWTQPDTDVESPNKADFFEAMHSARVAFSITSEDGFAADDMEVFNAMIEALPLDCLVTLTAHGKKSTSPHLWHRAPKWPLLWLVRLTPSAAYGFMEALLEDNGGRESPLLPSLTKLVLIDTALVDITPTARMICDALVKRAEQGVPLEILDLRTCLASSRAVELLSEIVVDVLGPEETVASEDSEQAESLFRHLVAYYADM
ncbi:hypothetical protein EDB86DRAFT_3210487 [Lactarius hatsudake]|nr:hypothetical protein EDB86DRAFT_3210487 [Lactarius hatsudake]